MTVSISRWKISWTGLPLAILLGGSLGALPQAIPTTTTGAPRSTITVHVYKAGLFSGLGHNHIVVAPVAESTVDASRMVAEILVHTKEMRVTDPGDSDSTRSEIQTTMLGPKVLDADRYPEIRFKSSKIEQTSSRHYRIAGTLELHGARKEIGFEVAGGPGHYQGRATLNQTDFGIQPISSAAGTIKVKNQIDIDLDVYENPAHDARR